MNTERETHTCGRRFRCIRWVGNSRRCIINTVITRRATRVYAACNLRIIIIVRPPTTMTPDCDRKQCSRLYYYYSTTETRCGISGAKSWTQNSDDSSHRRRRVCLHLKNLFRFPILPLYEYMYIIYVSTLYIIDRHRTSRRHEGFLRVVFAHAYGCNPPPPLTTSPA